MAMKVTLKPQELLAKSTPARQSTLQKQCSFKDEHMTTFFNLLIQHNIIKLSENKRPKKIEKSNDLHYFLYHQIIGHSMKDCYIHKDKI